MAILHEETKEYQNEYIGSTAYEWNLDGKDLDCDLVIRVNNL